MENEENEDDPSSWWMNHEDGDDEEGAQDDSERFNKVDASRDRRILRLRMLLSRNCLHALQG